MGHGYGQRRGHEGFLNVLGIGQGGVGQFAKQTPGQLFHSIMDLLGDKRTIEGFSQAKTDWEAFQKETIQLEGELATQRSRLSKDLCAFYFRKLGFGFGQAIEINTYTHGPSRLQFVGVKWLSGNVSGPTADASPRATNSPYSLNWKVMREAFNATKEAALGAIEGKRYLKGTKCLPIEPLTVKEVRKALEAGPARRRAEAKP